MKLARIIMTVAFLRKCLIISYPQKEVNDTKKSLSYSLRNRSYNTYKVGSSNSNTRRNTNRSHKVTPKRKINNKSNSGIKKKTKKIIYLKYY